MCSDSGNKNINAHDNHMVQKNNIRKAIANVKHFLFLSVIFTCAWAKTSLALVLLIFSVSIR